MKVCTTCKQEKPLSEFHRVNRATGARKPRAGMGVAATCKHCKAEKRKPGIHAERAVAEDRMRRGVKLCSDCKSEKPFSAFTKRVASPDSLSHRCRGCNGDSADRWRQRNPGAHVRWYQQNREARSAAFREWREANKSRLADSYAAWARKNKHIVNSIVARRIAAKLMATPLWADEAAIRSFYRQAAALTEETGVRHEVDHIYPLQGKTVCGLHCEANLQILTKTENLQKGNKMPEDYAARSSIMSISLSTRAA